MSEPLLARELTALAQHPRANASTTSFLVGSPPQPDSLLLRRAEFSIHIARSAAHRMKSAELVAHMYHSRGYDPGAGDGIAAHPGRVTLVACNDEGVFGTLTVCVESPFGLPADAVYGAELAPFRLAGRKLMELTALAVRPEHGSRTLLGALFHFAHIYGTVLQRATDVFIEVNPRHVDFYERMLNFRQAGPQKNCPRVQAPAILLHLETAHVSREVAERITTGKSLYPCFFSAGEERNLARRMRRITKDEPMRILNPPPERLYPAGPREPR